VTQGSVKYTAGIYKHRLFSLGLGRVSNFRNGNLFVFGARDFEVMRNINVPFNGGHKSEVYYIII
jgi:hypothetical protein